MRLTCFRIVIYLPVYLFIRREKNPWYDAVLPCGCVRVNTLIWRYAMFSLTAATVLWMKWLCNTHARASHYTGGVTQTVCDRLYNLGVGHCSLWHRVCCFHGKAFVTLLWAVVMNAKVVIRILFLFYRFKSVEPLFFLPVLFWYFDFYFILCCYRVALLHE